MDQVLQFLQGRKTYLSAAATILTAVGTMAGAVSPVTGASIGAICLALALMAQRFATATTQEQIVSAVLDGVAEIHGAAPATIPITPKPSQPTDVNLFDPNRQ